MVWNPCVSDCAIGIPLKTTSLWKSTPPLMRLLKLLPVTPGARKTKLSICRPRPPDIRWAILARPCFQWSY